ncbi:keratin, type I cytoskeletal 19-like [Archocentrus centrarchus]|uniref:keratin, type I cytoskeletal 19-like n=1 Tax=Archocentrus centrarchus TaxID=63155 RepID=UPI0011EA50B3|nr:keratin, type I cytoskeletal 19-like [Archocentrus centrarchus]
MRKPWHDQQSSHSVKQRTYSSSSLSGWKKSHSSSVSFQGYAPSMHGGAGGYGTRISQSTSIFSSGSLHSYGETSVIGDEKATMQHLNDRLAEYLAKVRALEAKNKDLQLNITEFSKKNIVVTREYSGYMSTISDLQAEIAKRCLENQAINLQIDNALLAAEDFKMKHEMELNLHMMAEADVSRLRGVRDSLTLNISDLEMNMESLKEELGYIKKNHEEEMRQLRIQSTGSVNVEVDSPESVDLTKILNEMREQYETVVNKNKLELEKWFQSKMELLQKEIIVCQTDVKTFHTELSELKRTFQSLEISQQSAHAEISCLQQNLEDVKGRYSLQLQQLQVTITTLETELQQLKDSIVQLQTEYNQLLDIKMRLEMEIAEYRRLLEGEHYEQTQTVVISKVVEVEEHKPHVEKRVKTIIEEIVDGKVVSSSVDTQVETIQ